MKTKFITLMKSNNLFLCVSLIIATTLCCLQYWLYWPGFIQDDSQTTFLLLKSGWHPIIMADLVEIMYTFFGYHIYHLFTLTLVPFYIGIWLFAYSAYKITGSWFALILFFPCFIENIFYAEIKLGSNSFANSYTYFLYGLTIFAISAPQIIKKKLFISAYVAVFLIALLGRHNAIMHVWPITFLWIGMFLAGKNYSFKAWLVRFIPLSFLSGIFCVILLTQLNSFMIRSDKGNSYPETLIVLHQIIGTCSFNFDENCFDESWWTEDWKDDPERMLKLRNMYMDNSLDPEPFVLYHYDNTPFKAHTDLKGRYAKWWYAVTKYPKDYFNHIRRYFSVIYNLPHDVTTAQQLQHNYTRDGMVFHSTIWNPISKREKAEMVRISNQFPEKELSLNLTGLRGKIDNFVRDNFMNIKAYIFININYIMFLIACLLVISNTKNLLYMFLAATSTSGLLCNILIPLFCPRVFFRYVDPIAICAVLSISTMFIILLKYRSGIKDFSIKKLEVLKHKLPV